MGQYNKQDIMDIIKETVNSALQAERIQAARRSGDAYKATEKRLYAHAVILRKIAEDTEKLHDIKTNGSPERSKSIMRYSRTGLRLSPDEIVDALVQNMTATIATDQQEADCIAGALGVIANDPYYAAVEGRFIKGQTDDEIAADICCDASTVRRNRGRLIRKLTIWLYGAAAL